MITTTDAQQRGLGVRQPGVVIREGGIANHSHVSIETGAWRKRARDL